MLSKLWHKWLARFPWQEIAGECPQLGPLLIRYDILKTRWGSIYIHHLLRSDESREHLHDHPWPFISIILRGGYWEWAMRRNSATGGLMQMWPEWYGAPHILFRAATSAHRLEMPAPTWTLVFVGLRCRPWGFHTKDGWVLWKKYGYKNLICPEEEGGEVESQT